MPRKKPAGKSRFKVYRPELPNKLEPDGKPEPKKRFTVHVPTPAPKVKGTRGAPSRRYVDVELSPPPEQRASRRFNVYVPLPPEQERYKPNGSAWIENDGYWMCEYGCKTFRVKEAPNGVDSDDYHAYDCPYWWEAGIDEAPF